ncbi:MAG: hypothetical protein JXA99_10150 [Candidatus Lokiarchaeota archaeon]|nr:hypothetical protein [Candidatus Lokiarchaeota archaeon]
MNEKKSDKENYIGFRLAEEFLKKLDIIVKQENKSRGLIAKDGIKEWIDLQLYNQNNNLLSISKTFFRTLLSMIDNNNIEEIAIDVCNNMVDILRFLVAKPMNENTFPEYIHYIINLFGKTGLRWFNSLNIEIKNNILLFRGIHDLEDSFSFFFIFFYKYLLSKFFNLNYNPKLEEMTSNFIHLDLDIKNQNDSNNV